MADKLAFLQIGLGSMGKRRIRNLFANGEKNVIGFDLSPERRKETEEKYGIKTIDDLTKLLDKDFDAIIISTPPNKHGDYIRFALKHKKHFFTEVSTSDDGYEDIFRAASSKIIKASSATMRHFFPIKTIKKLVSEGRIGKIFAYQYHMGQYLPDWHPWEDYRKVFFSKKETGACRELFPFELCWLNWLINSRVASISGSLGKVSDLDMDAEDVLAANLRYENNVFGNIMIDAISRKPVRNLRIMGSDGTLEWDWQDWIIKVYNAASKKTEVINAPKENPAAGYTTQSEAMHEEEIKAFLDAIYGRTPYPYTFEEDLLNLKTLYKLEAGGGVVL